MQKTCGRCCYSLRKCAERGKIRSENVQTRFFLEVKAVSGRSKSLATLIQSERYPDIRFGVKLSAGNIGLEKQVYTFPLCCGFLLRRWRDRLFG